MPTTRAADSWLILHTLSSCCWTEMSSSERASKLLVMSIVNFSCTMEDDTNFIPVVLGCFDIDCLLDVQNHTLNCALTIQWSEPDHVLYARQLKKDLTLDKFWREALGEIVAVQLIHIFKIACRSKTVLLYWQTSMAVPIFKKGD